MLNPAAGPARERLDRDEFLRLQANGTAIVDERRRRPLYFDGRFLAARDLTRDQTYFLSRQADIGLVAGAGVVNGLMVQAVPGSSTSLRISAGHGVTPAGESVILPAPLTIQLADVPEIQRLDAAFGLIQIPREPARNRTGLYVVALRPVEFTANQIASYPTTITGTRSTHDGDIVEGVVVTLVPYPDEGTRGEIDLRRANAARDIFVTGGRRGLPAAALPLAMIALDRGIVRWIDPFLVRREVGAEREQILGLGFAPRALREAHIHQYEAHLQDVLRQRASSNRGRRFAASEHFVTLPAAGRMPSAAIDPADFTQIYFPPEIDVELSIIPADEVPALVEDSLLLQPIDLTLTGEQQASTSVLILVPVPREQVRELAARLTTLRVPFRRASPGLIARQQPLEVLRGLRFPGVSLPVLDAAANVLTTEAVTVADAAWREVLRDAELVWYVRQRNARFKADVLGLPVRVNGNDVADEQAALDAVRRFNLTTRYRTVIERGSLAADAEIVSLLSTSKIIDSKLLLEGALTELERRETLDQSAALAVTTRFNEPELGEGIARLEKVTPDLGTNATLIRNVAGSGAVPELDRLVRLVKTDEELQALSETLVVTAKTGEPERVAELINKELIARRGVIR
jgi:hypothetical protein